MQAIRDIEIDALEDGDAADVEAAGSEAAEVLMDAGELAQFLPPPPAVDGEKWSDRLQQHRGTAAHGNKNDFLCQWAPDNTEKPWERQVIWNGNPNPKMRVSNVRLRNHARGEKTLLRPVDFFYEFFTPEWIERMVHATNAYVKRKSDPILTPHDTGQACTD